MSMLKMEEVSYLSLCVVKSHFREKMARRSRLYISCDVYHAAGRARTALFVCVFVSVGDVGGVGPALKPK